MLIFDCYENVSLTKTDTVFLGNSVNFLQIQAQVFSNTTIHMNAKTGIKEMTT